MKWPMVVLGLGSSYIGRICDQCRKHLKFGDSVYLADQFGMRLIHKECVEEAREVRLKEA